jgi:hypothetical protein
VPATARAPRAPARSIRAGLLRAGLATATTLAVAIGPGLPAAEAQTGRPAAAAAPRQPAPKPTAAPPATATDADERQARAGRAALERGDAAKAIELVDPVLAKSPGHPTATAVKVDALLGLGKRTEALDAYDRYYAVVKLEDTAVLSRITVAELESLQSEPLLQVDAIAALTVLPGQPGARARVMLTEYATATPPSTRSWPAIVALCRLGDAAAAKRAAQAYRESTGSGRVAALEAVIAGGGAGAEAILRDALGVRDAMVQSTAADGAATLKLRGLVPDLQQVTKTGELFARFTAAVALAHLGATGGETLLAAGATSPALDARLRVAGARRARGDKGWVDAVRPLLDAEDVAVRYQAAAMLLDTDRTAALKPLQAGTQDPNPAVRTLVADVITRDPATPVAELRRLLRDGIGRVRLVAAAAILRRAAPPSAK